MPNDQLTDEQQLAQGHPTPWSEMFDHSDPPMFENAGPSYYPDEKSSAVRHARTRLLRDAEAAKQRDLAVVARAADELNDERALEQVVELLRSRRKVPVALRIRAARAAARQGVTVSTAELHAANARRRS